MKASDASSADHCHHHHHRSTSKTSTTLVNSLAIYRTTENKATSPMDSAKPTFETKGSRGRLGNINETHQFVIKAYS